MSSVASRWTKPEPTGYRDSAARSSRVSAATISTSSVCLPLTKETEHIANAELLCAMKDGAVIVNISRGGIIDTDALITELKSGRLRAALDVFEQEPLDADSELWDLPNAVITPHNSFVGDGNRARLFSLIINNLK